MGWSEFALAPDDGAEGLHHFRAGQSRLRRPRPHLRKAHSLSLWSAGTLRPARRSGVAVTTALGRSQPHWHLGLEFWRVHDNNRSARSRRYFQSGLRGRPRYRLAFLRHYLYGALYGPAEAA